MANPFDQFDAPAPAAAAAPAANPFDKFDAPKPTFLGGVADTVAGGLRGLQRGIVGAPGIPASIANLVGSGMDALVGGSAALVGMKPLSPQDQAHTRALTHIPDSGDLNNAADAFQTATGGGQPYTPTGLGGKIAQTVGEMVPAAVATGGASVPNILRQAVAPGVTSELAGQATQGTAIEPYARLGGALLGGGAAGLTALPGAVDRSLARVGGALPAHTLDAAQQFMENAKSQYGVDITVPEALDFLTNKATDAGRVMRLAEMVPAGRDLTADFISRRYGQTADAMDNALDRVSPRLQGAYAPEKLATSAQGAAESALLDLEAQRTAAVDPLYEAAKKNTVPVDGMHAILARLDAAAAEDKTGILAKHLNDLRATLIDSPATPGTPAVRTPVLGPNGQVIRYEMTPATPGAPEVPITDVGNLDRVRKDFRDRVALPEVAERAIPKEQGRAITDILNPIDDLMLDSSPTLQLGRDLYGRISDEVVNPAQASPLGAIHATNQLPTQLSAIFPSKPMEGSDATTAAVIRALDAQAPGVGSALARQQIASQFAESAQRNMSGVNPQGAAKAAAAMTGNELQEQNLFSALRALPNGATIAPDISSLLDIYRATGLRQNLGSLTAPNTLALADLGRPPLIKQFGEAVVNPGGVMRSFGDRIEATTLRNRGADLASILLGENPAASMGRIRAAQNLPTLGGVFGRALVPAAVSQQGGR